MHQKNICRILFFLAAFFTHRSFAQDFYCPTTHQYIKMGSSSAEVELTCGPPIKKENREIPVYEKITSTQLVYRFNPYPYDNIERPSIIVTLAGENGKVTSILVAGKEQESTDACNSTNLVKIGDSEPYVIANCDWPSIRTTSTGTVITGKRKIIVWQYQFAPFQPITEFEFEEDRLVKIKTAQ